MLYFNANLCLFLYFYLFFSQFQKENACVLFLGKMTFLPCCILWKFVAYMYAGEASVDMDISMDIHGYIHGYPRKICGYGYGWEISYPRCLLFWYSAKVWRTDRRRTRTDRRTNGQTDRQTSTMAKTLVTRDSEWAGMPSESKFVVHSWTIEVHSKHSARISGAFQTFGHILATSRNVLRMFKTFEVQSK